MIPSEYNKKKTGSVFVLLMLYAYVDAYALEKTSLYRSQKASKYG